MSSTLPRKTLADVKAAVVSSSTKNINGGSSSTLQSHNDNHHEITVRGTISPTRKTQADINNSLSMYGSAGAKNALFGKKKIVQVDTKLSSSTSNDETKNEEELLSPPPPPLESPRTPKVESPSSVNKRKSITKTESPVTNNRKSITIQNGLSSPSSGNNRLSMKLDSSVPSTGNNNNNNNRLSMKLDSSPITTNNRTSLIRPPSSPLITAAVGVNDVAGNRISLSKSVPPPPLGTPKKTSVSNINVDSMLPPPPPPPPEFDDAEEAPPPPPPATDSPLMKTKKSFAKTNLFPIANPYINVLVGDLNPFAGKMIEAANVDSVTTSYENAILSAKSVRNGTNYLTAINKQDVLVVGASWRTGAATVLKYVDSLLHSNSLDLENESPIAIVRRSPWLESKMFEKEPIHPELNSEGRRCLMTYFSYATLYQSFIFNTKKNMLPKMIVTLRNPADARLSFFRLCRRVFRLANGGVNNSKNFDDYFVSDDFGISDLAPCSNVRKDANNEKNCIEQNIKNWYEAKKAYPDKILLVFYEQLVVKPQIVYDQIAAFLEVKPGSPKQLEALTKTDPNYPLGSKEIPINELQSVPRKQGSFGKANRKFLSTSLQRMDVEWSLVWVDPDAKKDRFSTYEEMFNTCLKITYPLPIRQRVTYKLDDARDIPRVTHDSLQKEIAIKYPKSWAGRKLAGDKGKLLKQQQQQSTRDGIGASSSTPTRFEKFLGLSPGKDVNLGELSSTLPRERVDTDDTDDGGNFDFDDNTEQQ